MKHWYSILILSPLLIACVPESYHYHDSESYGSYDSYNYAETDNSYPQASVEQHGHSSMELENSYNKSHNVEAEVRRY